MWTRRQRQMCIRDRLMGDKVAPRREFIETHSSNLDMATLDI